MLKFLTEIFVLSTQIVNF